MSVVIAPHLSPSFGSFSFGDHGLEAIPVLSTGLSASILHVTGPNLPPASVKSVEWVPKKAGEDELTEITNMFEKGRTTPPAPKPQSSVDTRVYLTSKSNQQTHRFFSRDLAVLPLSQTSLSNVAPAASFDGGPLNIDPVPPNSRNHNVPFSIGHPRSFPITDSEIVKRPRERPPPVYSTGRPIKHPIPFPSITVTRPVEKPKKTAIFPLDESFPASSGSNPSLAGTSLSDAKDRKPSSGSNATSMSLVGALSSAFSENAAQNSSYEIHSAPHSLVGAMTSAFSGNVGPENFYSDNDLGAESPESDSDPQITERHFHKRRQAFKPVPQIISPEKSQLRSRHTPKGPYLIPSEQILERHLAVEKLLALPPLGTSVARENAKEYLDIDEEVLLDRKSGAEVHKLQRRQVNLETRRSIWKNNLRFVMKQRSASTSTQSAPFRQYHTSSLPSSTTYLQRVQSECGEAALDGIMGELPSWETNLKPRKYRREVDAVPSEAESEEKHSGPTKRSHSHEIHPRKKVKFSNSDPRTCTSNAINHQFNAVLCAELLQKLVKGKVRITGQELEQIALFLEDPLLERVMKASPNRDVDIEYDKACDSIWHVLQRIAQSPPDTLGIPEDVERVLKWQAEKIVRNVKLVQA
ncbi:hypothetical protein BDP27DRAFT_1348682 [Rhodocollybia butyracea]|uniref:Uncharacterized protein n=1 Tax=Rhodocollybia butyracea TaxID=206335 RepID=A0A9P5P1F1_9AGAR|nr:hypothetical protein BDP27DRAFT_1348682 [Rhodocollybia butyracea]